jgi:hypothetical protein
MKIQKKLQNWVWKEIISWAHYVFTLPNLEIFNSENVKKNLKKSVHTWDNNTCYISYEW